jgi:beta-N-acetylhexosaminidase
MKFRGHFLNILLLAASMFALLSGVTNASASVSTQDSIPFQKARQLLSQMSPEERIGQLFLVSFEGQNIDSSSQIYDLITKYHIGGVLLLAANDNFTGPDNTAEQARELISGLQQIAWDNAQSDSPDLIDSPSSGKYIPLFIAMSQEGDSYPYDEIINGLTPLPNQLAIGATWSTELTKEVGEVQGQELASLGINMLLGPSMDVLDMMYVENSTGIGTRSFGGNAYWVGELGKSYIEGVHTGSGNRITVIAKHFPGMGSSDRDPESEVATVRKPLELFEVEDLAPFFSITGNATSPDNTTDGLLVGHIRYEALQGNIRTSTKPISFDTAVMEQLISLPQLSTWREDGGIIVSDNLGSESIKKFFDPMGMSFDARQVARSAINAGNDLLILDNFVATGDADQYTTLTRTIDFLTNKYLEDAVFAQQVDSSVERLLAKKYSMYSEFSWGSVAPSTQGLEDISTIKDVTFRVAQASATLLSPSISELSAALPSPPQWTDQMVFITDINPYKQCSDCPEQNVLAIDTLRKAVLRLYGPGAGGQITQYRQTVYTFNDLINLLNGSEEGDTLEADINAADWVVFAFTTISQDRPASSAIKRLLDERPELIQNKYTVAFAFNAPYFLDATEVSKLSAYYGIYSKLPSFSEIAARILFQETVPTGALPISVPAIGYDLNIATSPDPNQYINLKLNLPNLPPEETTETVTPAATLEPTPVPSFNVGDTLPLITSTIFDHNHKPVPDGTMVRFTFTLEGESASVQQIESTTQQGVAQADFLIQNEGRLIVNVTSGDAQASDKLVLNISGGKAAVVTVIAPTPTPTITLEPTATVPSPTYSPTPTSTPIPPVPPKTSGVDWLLSMGVIWGSSSAIYWFGKRRISIRWGVRWGLLAVIGGICAYLYLSMDLPSNQVILDRLGTGAVLAAVLIGMGVGWGTGWIWRIILKRKSEKTSDSPNVKQ